MAAKLTFLGHSCFLIESADHKVLIDPFLDDNPQAQQAGIKAADIHCDTIVLTHGHADHISDAPAIAKRTGAKVHAAYELAGYLGSVHGVENLEPMAPGGRVEREFGYVALTQAFHSSSHEHEGTVHHTGPACGAVVNIAGKTIYHAGDTAIFSDMKLIGTLYMPHVAILPVGDRFTMGPEHASKAAEMVGAPVTVPCHYGTWPEMLVSDISHFKPAGSQVRALKPGESMSI